MAGGLNGPFGLSAGHGHILVAENFANQVRHIDDDGVSVETAGIPSPAGVTQVGDRVVIVTGAGDEPVDGDASVWVGKEDGEKQILADLQAYELETTPTASCTSIPTRASRSTRSPTPSGWAPAGDGRNVYVADGGANDVLYVTPDGEVSTFFVPPVVTTGACEGKPNNDPEHTGCDPVPTGVAVGPDGRIYVSTLSAEAPGEGIVYILDESGEVLDTIDGFDGPTGVAVDDRRERLRVGGPPRSARRGRAAAARLRPLHDRADRAHHRHGDRTYAEVTMPVGLDFKGGKLYSTAWSVALFLGIPDRGEVVLVRPSAFGPAPEAVPAA